MLSKQRPQTVKQVDQLLICINQNQLDGESVSEAITCKKATLLHAHFIKKMPGESKSVVSDFKASRD